MPTSSDEPIDIQSLVNPALCAWVYEMRSLPPYKKELMFQELVKKHVKRVVAMATAPQAPEPPKLNLVPFRKVLDE